MRFAVLAGLMVPIAPLTIFFGVLWLQPFMLQANMAYGATIGGLVGVSLSYALLAAPMRGGGRWVCSILAGLGVLGCGFMLIAGIMLGGLGGCFWHPQDIDVCSLGR